MFSVTVRGRYTTGNTMMNSYLISRNQQYAAGTPARIELYKNLLQPHFLFNSLNNLYALSLKKSEQTPEAIAGLSQLLERVVSCSRKDEVCLSEEIALINEYIALERIWLGDYSFLVDLQVKGDTRKIFIPPLTIYTLIENAFKHGIRKCEDQGWITIHLLVKKDRVLVNIRNSVNEDCGNNHESNASNTGLGIEAVKRLLDDSFKKSYHLDARSIGNVFAVDLIIGQKAA